MNGNVLELEEELFNNKQEDIGGLNTHANINNKKEDIDDIKDSDKELAIPKKIIHEPNEMCEGSVIDKEVAQTQPNPNYNSTN